MNSDQSGAINASPHLAHVAVMASLLWLNRAPRRNR
jgi:hypothetical protein